MPHCRSNHQQELCCGPVFKQIVNSLYLSVFQYQCWCHRRLNIGLSISTSINRSIYSFDSDHGKFLGRKDNYGPLPVSTQSCSPVDLISGMKFHISVTEVWDIRHRVQTDRPQQSLTFNSGEGHYKHILKANRRPAVFTNYRTQHLLIHHF